ncbi:MAG: TIGR03084 family metal-binding protein [Acidimicrobiia bacterium]|nr:TIGR03084 family metal-binding protein [Acidimicrobiia bacterium]
MPTLADIRADLAAEHGALDDLVAAVGTDQFAMATPAEGWDVADQLGHLGYFDRAATQAIIDPEAFEQTVASLMSTSDDVAAMDATLAEPRSLDAGEVVAWWRTGRDLLQEAAASLDESTRLPWYGPPMGAKSFLTARLMETWAHGLDIADTIGVEVEPTDRLLHICHLGVLTRAFSYIVRGREVASGDVRVELAGPGGDRWTFGPENSSDRVTGPAVDFCQVVTQRRHVDDTAIEATGPLAVEWMSIAQAFAGGPGPGRERGPYAEVVQ